MSSDTWICCQFVNSNTALSQVRELSEVTSFTNPKEDFEKVPPFRFHKDYAPGIQKELKVVEAKTVKSSIDEPLEVELKDFPPHLEYTFLEGDDNHGSRPVVMCTKKGGITVVKNDDNDLIPTRLVTGWRVCIDRKLNEATRKDHFPLPFMDQMLERLVGNSNICFSHRLLGLFSDSIDPKDQKRQHSLAIWNVSPIARMPFGYVCNLGTFQRCMMESSWTMIEKDNGRFNG
ncbi:hypothetical protein Tco_1053691 [Tanacetum coccineum]|uniref:Reverse transcriptase domain-containing protein n=1 Tax=Tanacetum coccineum TaxID=301880 RepID=A0ABQ5GVN2_9ASTR